MSHTCVERTWVPLAKLMVRGDDAILLLATSVPSIIKMEVAPVSAMAWFGANIILLPTLDIVFTTCARCEVFDATTVASSLPSAGSQPIKVWVGSEECMPAETKLLCLFANLLFSAPHRQVLRPEGRTDLCMPRVHGS